MADATQSVIDFLTRFTAALGVRTPVDVEQTPDSPRLNIPTLLRNVCETFPKIPVPKNTLTEFTFRGEVAHVHNKP